MEYLFFIRKVELSLNKNKINIYPIAICNVQAIE